MEIHCPIMIYVNVHELSHSSPTIPPFHQESNIISLYSMSTSPGSMPQRLPLEISLWNTAMLDARPKPPNRPEILLSLTTISVGEVWIFAGDIFLLVKSEFFQQIQSIFKINANIWTIKHHQFHQKSPTSTSNFTKNHQVHGQKPPLFQPFQPPTTFVSGTPWLRRRLAGISRRAPKDWRISFSMRCCKAGLATFVWKMTWKVKIYGNLTWKIKTKT